MNSQPPGPHEGRISVRASAGVQGESSMDFGTLVWVEGTQMLVRVDSELNVGESVAVRVDLSPAPGTALLEAQVVRKLLSAAGEGRAYLIRQRRVAAPDEVRWQAFLLAKQSGGTLSDFSDVHDSGTALQPSYGPRSGISSAARPASAFTGAHGLNAAGDIQTGRAAMRDALRAAIVRPARPLTAADPTPGAIPASGSARAAWASEHAPPVPTPSRLATPSPRPMEPKPTDLPKEGSLRLPETPAEPAWLASNVGGVNYLEVKWTTPEGFNVGASGMLATGVLSLVSDGRSLPKFPPIHMLLRHQTLALQCPATPVTVHPTSVTYSLQLSPSQLSELRRAARIE